MKITDLKIGQFATRNWYNNSKTLCVKRYNLNSYEYWENGKLSSTVRNNSSEFKYDDFKLCDCNGKIIKEFTYPLYMEDIFYKSTAGRVVKFVSLTEGTVIIQGNSTSKVGENCSCWIEHTNKAHWTQVNFNEDLNKIIPTQDDIDELISDLKSIIEDDDNRFCPSEYGAGTQLRESGYDKCHDLIDEWMYKYHITKAPSILNEKHYQYFDDLYDVIVYIESTLLDNELDEPIIGVDYASQPDITYPPETGATSRLHDDEFDALPYAKHIWDTYNGAAKNVVNNLNQTKEFTMTKELQEAILELIATNGKPKVKKPKTPKIVCDVNGELMRFVDEAELKAFMWSSRVESVIRYDLAGKVTVPFELTVEAPKTKASK